MKKKFLPSFQPPRLVRGGGGWYVVWYEANPATGALQRFRNTFQLNRIAAKAKRLERAQAILEEISRALASGGYVYAGKQETGLGFASLREAVTLARDLKTHNAPTETLHAYNSMTGIFLDWAQAERLDLAPVKSFTRLAAVRFLDYLVATRKVGARTRNNYLIILKAIWNTLRERGYLETNPWTQVKKAREAEKGRRTFHAQEAAAVAAYAAAHDRPLYAAILLQYYCFVRPNEIRGLRRRDFDLQAGTVRIPAALAKARVTRLVTMPESVRAFFGAHYGATPQAYYIWGPDRAPHPQRQQGKNQFNRMHREILDHLHTSGALTDISGLSFYSWKDTGLTDHARSIGLLDLMRQAGHHDPKITLVYIHQGAQNEAFRNVEGEIGKD
jgi:integrase